ncbi:Spo0E family sporulation regulatory protein-aspartic acid phosphatase [Bacillus pseudomycoides]|uniref:Spo0E family sporulation regulatory protein-aspartic acid phosphatase n=1 Tax=Bacillus pseudomycoides TaxID=64104 RepID=UPI0037BF08E9
MELVKHYGFCHPRVLKFSQDLDKLIIRMMKQSEIRDIITKQTVIHVKIKTL